MGTSNWQNIPYCIDLMRKIQPISILDIGVGFGRWGILAREFLDVWFNRVHPADWLLQIDGIEAYSPNLHTYHKTFYNTIHQGDAFDVIQTIGQYDLIILGDVLEHFTPERAKILLTHCKRLAGHVMLNVPLEDIWPQDDLYENPFEKHLSFWKDEQLTTEDLVERQIFSDFRDRPFGVYLYKGSQTPPEPIAKKKSLNTLTQEFIVNDLSGYFQRHPHRAKILYKLINTFRCIGNRFTGNHSNKKA